MFTSHGRCLSPPIKPQTQQHQLDGAVKVTLQFLPDPVANPAAFARGVSDLRATLKNAVNANDGGDGGDDQQHLLNSEDVESSVEAAWEAAKQQQQELNRKKGLGSAGAAVMMLSEAELNGMYLVDRAYEAAAVKIQAQLRAWRRTAEAGGLVADFGNKAMVSCWVWIRQVLENNVCI